MGHEGFPFDDDPEWGRTIHQRSARSSAIAGARRRAGPSAET